MSLRRGFLFIVLMAGTALPQLTRNEYAANLNLEGIRLLEEGNLKEAELIFRDVIRLEPYNSSAYANLAVALELQGKFSEAELMYRKSIELNPFHAQSHHNLGYLLKKRGILDSAEVEYRLAIRLNPSNSTYYNNLGVLLGQKGNFSGAIASYIKAIQLDSLNAHPYYNLGMLLKDQKMDHLAEPLFRRAIEINPNYAEAHHSLGALLHRKGDWDGAESEYRAAIFSDSGVSLYYSNLGNLLTSKKNYDEAEAVLRKSIELDYNNISAHCNLAALHYFKGDYETTEEELRIALSIDPNDIVSLNNLGSMYANRGDYKLADGILLRAFQLSQGLNSHLNYNLVEMLLLWSQELLLISEVQMAEGKIKDAVEIIDRYNTSGPRDELRLKYLAHFTYGRILVMKKKYKKAIREFNRALDVEPKDPRTHYNIAYVYYLRKKWDEAERHVIAALFFQRNYPLAEKLKEEILDCKIKAAKSLKRKWWLIPILVMISAGLFLLAIKYGGIKWFLYPFCLLFMLCAVTLALAMIIPIEELSVLSVKVKFDADRVEDIDIPVEFYRIETQPSDAVKR